jgi:hypothetical protein
MSSIFNGYCQVHFIAIFYNLNCIFLVCWFYDQRRGDFLMLLIVSFIRLFPLNFIL